MRKQPRQERSRELVRALIEATGRVLVACGLEATTTNHIAREAGVDIASLYQYFADKDDLIEALVRRMTDEVVDAAARHFQAADVFAATPEELLRGTFTFGLALARANPVLREIARESKYLFDSTALGVLERQLQVLATAYFRHHFRSYPIADLEVRLHIVSVSTFATLARHFGDERPLVSDETLIEELVRMFAPYLAGKRTQPKTKAEAKVKAKAKPKARAKRANRRR